jgi:tetratricopeptide (TPR) repeat protein
MKAFKLIIIGLFISMMQITAQTGLASGTQYGIGEDSIRCMRNLSLYSEDFRNKSFKEAFVSWEKVFNECPAATVNIYIDGVTMIKQQIAENRDAGKFEELYQLLMKVWDRRIEYFGDHPRVPTPSIKGFKAVDMLTYKRNDSQVLKEAYGLLNEAVTALGRRSDPRFLATLMNSAVNVYRMGEIDAEVLVNKYTLILDIVDHQLKDPSQQAFHAILEEVKVGVEGLFASSGAANCEIIEKIYLPQLEDNKYDLAWLKRVSQLLARGLCEDTELLYQVSEFQHNIEPSSSSAYGLARMYLKSRDIPRAIEFYNDAIRLSEDDNQRGDYLHHLALIHLSQENYSLARTNALRAIEAKPNWGAPYILIGRAYAASANSVGSDDFEKKAVYWAAVDKFMRAKSVDPSVTAEANDLIKDFTLHFPALNDIFFRNMKQGDTFTIGGWINERTTVRAR